jgi:nucleotide-binding universal stress UspA family protein
MKVQAIKALKQRLKEEAGDLDAGLMVVGSRGIGGHKAGPYG